ncbi:hypothetical protein EVAR_87769_1 [Eumeta japonica]|uniref:Mos1 transposase HTH domain-containing protein n=1 Tax=Eumeta variegata TaxID=151549 RepID=A0A4C1X5B0_EUMVA|nr:hypothetical protein EVAR_87769_1 [Eumeta japonica]
MSAKRGGVRAAPALRRPRPSPEIILHGFPQTTRTGQSTSSGRDVRNRDCRRKSIEKNKPYITCCGMVNEGCSATPNCQQESYDRLRLTFYDETPSLSAVYNWFNEFKLDHTNLTDDRREGCLSTVTTDDNVSAVRFLIEADKSDLPVDADKLRHRFTKECLFGRPGSTLGNRSRILCRCCRDGAAARGRPGGREPPTRAHSTVSRTARVPHVSPPAANVVVQEGVIVSAIHASACRDGAAARGRPARRHERTVLNCSRNCSRSAHEPPTRAHSRFSRSAVEFRAAARGRPGGREPPTRAHSTFELLAFRIHVVSLRRDGAAARGRPGGREPPTRAHSIVSRTARVPHTCRQPSAATALRRVVVQEGVRRRHERTVLFLELLAFRIHVVSLPPRRRCGAWSSRRA